jgi:hypothetical protein
MEAINKDLVDGVFCYRCAVCGAILVRMEARGLLGEELNFLDVMVIKDHLLAKHGLAQKPN